MEIFSDIIAKHRNYVNSVQEKKWNTETVKFDNSTRHGILYMRSARMLTRAIYSVQTDDCLLAITLMFKNK